MGKDSDWYRNENWSPTIAEAFDAKLRRARGANRGQYLRIQACTLATSRPEVALALLDRYFELDAQFDRAQAFADRATSLLALSRVDEAIEAFEGALEREAEMPNALTTTYVEYPFLVATRRIRARYARVLDVLLLNASRPTFPIEHFRWNAARALIAHDTGDADSARAHAERALEAAARRHSGFSRHSSLGLVTAAEATTVRDLRVLLPR